MPVEVRRFSLGTPPTRTVKRGPLAGQEVPRYEVILPGWSDIIHLQSGALLTDAERAVERQRRLAQLRNSPTPQVVQNFARIGQAVDDVQDGLVTLSVAGRLLTKLRGKAIPGVGVITTLADALNVLNIFYPNTLARAATGGLDRLGQAVSGRRKYLASKEVKRALGLNATESLSTYLRRLNETLKTGKLGFGIGEALQIAQTSDLIFGIGLSLGPIFGGIQDALFGFLRGARFDLSGVFGLNSAALDAAALEREREFAPGSFDLYERRARDLAERQGLPVPASSRDIARLLARNPVRVQVDFPGIFGIVDRVLGAPLGTTDLNVAERLRPFNDLTLGATNWTIDKMSVAKRAVISAAVKVWDSGKYLVGLRGDLSWQDHVELMVAQALAVQELSPLLQQFDWPAAALFDIESEQPLLPFCDRSCLHPRSPAAVAGCLVAGPGTLSFDWLDEIPDRDLRDFCEQTIIQSAGDLYTALEGRAAKVVEDSGPWFRILRMLHDYNLLPPYTRSDEETAAFLESLFPFFRDPDYVLPSVECVATLYVRAFPGVESESSS